MKNFLFFMTTTLATMVNRVHAAPPPSEEPTYNRTVKTTECQKPIESRDPHWKDRLQSAGFKIINVANDKVYFCDTDKYIPVKPVCIVSQNEGRGSQSETLTPRYELIYGKERWIFETSFAGHQLNINTAPLFSDLDLKLTEISTGLVKSKIEGVQRAAYYSNTPSPIKYSLLLEGNTFSVMCNFIDKD